MFPAPRQLHRIEISCPVCASFQQPRAGHRRMGPDDQGWRWSKSKTWAILESLMMMALLVFASAQFAIGGNTVDHRRV
jgi:hypothetical protein